MITATKARWKRGTFTFPCHANDSTMAFPGWRYRNVILFKQGCRSWDAWSIVHAPTMLGLGARWSRLRDAKAAVEAIDGEIGLTLLDDHESWDPETRAAIVAAIRRHREFA
jgi:hypothetical protein